MANNTNSIADLFKGATAITRGASTSMANGFKVYKDKVAIKDATLNGGDKVLVKITKTQIIFTKSEDGNRTLTGKGTDGRVMLSLNEQMRKVMAQAFKAHKQGNECATLELRKEEEGGATYYVLDVNAKVVA